MRLSDTAVLAEAIGQLSAQASPPPLPPTRKAQRRDKEKQGNIPSSDSGRLASECLVLQAQKCAKLWCQHMFARATCEKEQRDPREGSLVMGRFVRLSAF